MRLHSTPSERCTEQRLTPIKRSTIKSKKAIDIKKIGSIKTADFIICAKIITVFCPAAEPPATFLQV